MPQPKQLGTLLPDNPESFQPLTASTQPPRHTSRDSNVNVEVRQTLAQLWLRMSEIYGAQFANQYGAVGGEAFQTWCLGLREMTPAMIKRGFTRLLEREKTFVPNLNEFRKLCQASPEALGLPSLTDAYQEAAEKWRSPSRKAWSHPVVYHAGKATGWFELGNHTRDKTYSRFKEAYNSLCERVMCGEAFELPERFDNAKLEKHTQGRVVKTQQNIAAGRDALAKMKASVGL